MKRFSQTVMGVFSLTYFTLISMRWTVTKYIYLSTLFEYTFGLCTLLEDYLFWKIFRTRQIPYFLPY